MATYTYVELIRQTLEDYLPDELFAEQLPDMLEYGYGLPILNPTQKLPRLYVDAIDWRQEDVDLARKKERELRVEVTAGIEGSDPVELSEQIQVLAEAITRTIEQTEPEGTDAWWEVRSCDFSPPVQRAHALAHFLVMEVWVHYDRDHGSSEVEPYLMRYAGELMQFDAEFMQWGG